MMAFRPLRVPFIRAESPDNSNSLTPAGLASVRKLDYHLAGYDSHENFFQEDLHTRELSA